MGKIAVFIIKGQGFKGIERQTAERVSRHLIKEGDDETLDLFEINRDNPLKLKDLYKNKDHDVFVLIYGNLYISRESIDSLSGIVLKQRDFQVVVPVSNESRVPLQRHGPSFFYQTLSVFKWAVRETYEQFKDKVIEAEDIDDFCFAFRRETLNRLPDDYLLADLPQVLKKSGLRFAIAKGVYVHRYGNNYESSRDDLLIHVPLDAKDVLDIGCANGMFGEVLKKRQDSIVTGIDSDAGLLETAKGRLNKVINGDIEDIIDKGTLDRYDCIVCGDVLEHFNDPWKVVKGLKAHLIEGGLLIASTPNIANWAIIHEMLKGRWDYVPFSILSGTHIRFFTRQTFEELFTDSGYKIKKSLLQHFGIPDKGNKFVGTLKGISLDMDMDMEELRASEIVVVAEA